MRQSNNYQQNKDTFTIKYKDLSEQEKAEVENKIDNFLEAIYIAPNLFERDVLHALKLREDRLKLWRNNGQILGGFLSLSLYFLYKRRNYTGFYFKNFWIMTSFVLISGYCFGRLGEMVGNKMYYKDVLVKFAVNYNISDSEVDELHLKINECVLSENKEQQRKGSLDKITFKI